MKVLLSIKPKYVERIFSGNKRFEYRKVIFKKNVNTLVIYATKPIGKIVGEIRIAKIYKDTPENIWIKTQPFSGMNHDDFFTYFQGKDTAYAIEFDKIVKYNNPVGLIYTPPQLYKYII